MSRKPNYEPGMRIDYDPHSHATIIAFRGRVLPIGEFPTEREAIHAGEEYCRKHGWVTQPALFSTHAQSLLPKKNPRPI